MGKKKHHQEKKERQFEAQEQTENASEKVEQETESKEVKEEESQVIAPKKVSYCPVCSLTFQLCKYGKQAMDCAVFLFKLAPTKVNKYHPDFKPQNIQSSKLSKGAQQIKGKSKQESKPKSMKDKYVVIDVKNRGKKNYVTTVTGLNNFSNYLKYSGIDCKQLSKKCSKKFAVSCSAIDQGSVQLQGDNFQAMKDFLLAEYKQVLKKKYVIDKQQFNEKVAEEKAKNKQAKKQQKNVIKQEPEGEEQKQQKQQQPEKNRNQIRMELMKQAEKEMQQNSDDE